MTARKKSKISIMSLAMRVSWPTNSRHTDQVSIAAVQHMHRVPSSGRIMAGCARRSGLSTTHESWGSLARQLCHSQSRYDVGRYPLCSETPTKTNLSADLLPTWSLRSTACCNWRRCAPDDDDHDDDDDDDDDADDDDDGDGDNNNGAFHENHNCYKNDRCKWRSGRLR